MLLAAFSQMQALASVAQPTGTYADMFPAEPEHFLAARSVGFRRNVETIGRSGFTTTFDYSFSHGMCEPRPAPESTRVQCVPMMSGKKAQTGKCIPSPRKTKATGQVFGRMTSAS